MAATRVLIFGTMRSGTTLICDLLTKPGQSLVLNEPMLRTPWRDTDERSKKLTNVAKRFGFSDRLIAAIGDKSVPPLHWFREQLRPQLETLQLWGIKEVFLDQAQMLVDEVRPDCVVLCVRNLRDVYLSSLDLVGNGLLAFPGGAPLRDEAWAVERLRADVSILGGLRSRAHFVVRYESFVKQSSEREALRHHLGLAAFGGGGATLRDSGEWRHAEAEKHLGGITDQSVGRHTAERDGFARTVAEAVAAEQPEFHAENGYDVATAGMAGFLQAPAGRRVVDDWEWNGQAGDLVYGRRRARKMLTSNVKEGARLIDVGCTVPAVPILLRGKAHALCVDANREGRLQYRRDWVTAGLPGLSMFTDASLLVVLEWYDREQILMLLSALSDAHLTIWIAYFCVEDRPATWTNTAVRSRLSRRDWHDIATALKCQLTGAWAFDQHLSFLRLRRQPDAAFAHVSSASLPAGQPGV